MSTDHEHDWRYPPPAAMEDGVWYQRCDVCGLTTSGALVLETSPDTAPALGTSSPAPGPVEPQ